jgi:hypothetical protein
VLCQSRGWRSLARNETAPFTPVCINTFCTLFSVNVISKYSIDTTFKMASSSSSAVPASALGMKPQVLMPLQPGAKNAMDSAQIAQQKTNTLQNELTKVGGRRRRRTRGRKSRKRRVKSRTFRTRHRRRGGRRHSWRQRGCGCSACRRRRRSRRTRCRRGGATTTVPYVSTYGVPDNGATANNMKAITSATVNQNVQAGFDACVGKGPSCTAQVYSQQQTTLK